MNDKLNYFVTLLLGFVGGACSSVFMGQAASEDHPNKAESDTTSSVIRARRFEVVAEDGTVLGYFSAKSDATAPSYDATLFLGREPENKMTQAKGGISLSYKSYIDESHGPQTFSILSVENGLMTVLDSTDTAFNRSAHITIAPSEIGIWNARTPMIELGYRLASPGAPGWATVYNRLRMRDNNGKERIFLGTHDYTIGEPQLRFDRSPGLDIVYPDKK